MSKLSLGQALMLLEEEYRKAVAKHGEAGDKDHRHHHSIIEEEYDEFWDAIKADNLGQADREAAQLGAMVLKYLMNCSDPMTRIRVETLENDRVSKPKCYRYLVICNKGNVLRLSRFCLASSAVLAERHLGPIKSNESLYVEVDRE